MRVLSIVSSLDPRRGGTQTVASNMVLATQRAGVSNAVVAAGTPDARRRANVLTEPLTCEGVEVEQFGTLPWPPERPDRWGLSLSQARLAAGHVGEFDLVHIHGAWGFGLLSGLTASRLRDTPVVVTPHESFTAFDIDGSRSELRRWQKLLLKRLYLRWTSLFILTSQLEVDDSLSSTETQRVRVIYPVVDSGRTIRISERRRSASELKVGFLGRIHPKKNLDVLIAAIAELPEHICLVVAGDGPDADARREQVQTRGLERRVDWRGFVSPDRRPDLFDDLDLLVMPSSFESFGMSAAEAMLHGTPVVVSERTGIAEIIRRRGGGVIVSPEVQSVADAIRQLDSERDTLEGIGREGEEAVRSELSFSTIGVNLVDAYTCALDASAR